MGMLGSLFIWFLAVVLTLVCIFFVIFVLISLVDVEDDHVNPIHMCEKVNKIIVPEYICQACIIILLVTGYWMEALFNVPLLGFHIYRLQGGQHLLDPTCIFSRTKVEKRINMGKFFFYILTLFYYMYQIIAIVTKAALGRKYGFA